MSDDIVTQLRGISDSKEWVKLRDWTIITAEAADEIERLRRSLQLMSIDMRTQLAGIKMRCKCGACD